MAGVNMTPKQEAWIAAAMAAQQRGEPPPPLPTEMAGVRNPGDRDYVTPIGDERPMANQGQRVLSPAYTDPRSQAIAQTPGMIRPVHSMLDRLFRPGRADTANQMNREYKENALAGQVAGRSAEADAALKELELRAKSGEDPAALEGLKKYYEVEALRRGGGGVQPWGQLGNKTVDGLVPAPKDGGGDTGGGDKPPPGNPYMSMTKEDSEKAFRSTSEELDKYIARYESIVAGNGRARSGRWEHLTGKFSGQDSIGATPNEVAEAVERVKLGKESKIKLQKQFEEAHSLSPANAGGPPLSGTDMGSATHSTVDR